MKHEQQTMQRGLMRMVHAKLAASLGTGRETAAEIKDAKFKMTGFLNKLELVSKFKKQLQSSWSRCWRIMTILGLRHSKSTTDTCRHLFVAQPKLT